MYWLEVGLGVYTILILILGVALQEKMGIDFAVTYVAGAAVGGILWVVAEAFLTRGHINFTPLLLTAFFGYLLFKRK